MAKKRSNPIPDNAEGQASVPAEPAALTQEATPEANLTPPDESTAEAAEATSAEPAAAVEAKPVLPQFKMQVLNRMEHVAPGGNVRFSVYLETRQSSPLHKPPVNEMRLNGLSLEEASPFEVGREYTLTFMAGAAE